MSEEASDSVLHGFDDEDAEESNKQQNHNSEAKNNIESDNEEDVENQELDSKVINDSSDEEGEIDDEELDTEKINNAYSHSDSDKEIEEQKLNCKEAYNTDDENEEKNAASEDEHGNLEIVDNVSRAERRHRKSLEEGEHDDESEKDIRKSLEEGEHNDENEREICDKAELLDIREKKLNKKETKNIEKEMNVASSMYKKGGSHTENMGSKKNKTNEVDLQNDNCSMYDVSEVQSNDLNCSFLSSDTTKESEEGKTSKRKSDEGLEIRDELDFEEDKESGEEGEDSDGESESKRKVVINKEEGELSEEDEDDPSLRQEPKTVCRFFNKGQCTWGTNCRFLHPGVSDKGNYNMFAAPKPQSQTEKEETTVDKERPREVRRYIPEPAGFESAWERGLRHAKEMMKRANKRKETDADFEEKRFNLSLGQAELDRENDYYTRPASPVYKPSDEVIEYLDPYEKQAIRHFRGGHFENFEVRYKVDQAYPRGPEHMRSRRDKFEREVTERIPRRIRATSPAVEEHKTVKEKRYPRPRTWKEERAQEVPAGGQAKGEAEVWADPWARRKTPVKRTKKVPRNKSYSSGSSSRSSRSSRSSSYSSYSRSGSRSTSKSRSSRSSSRSITPPIHPRQQRATMNRGGGRGGRGRGIDRGGRGGGPPRNFYQTPQYSQPPNPPPNHPLAPDVNFLRQHAPGAGIGSRRGHGREDNRFPNSRSQETRNLHPGSTNERFPNSRSQETRNLHPGSTNERFVAPRPQEPRTQPVPKERVPPMQFKQEPKFSQEPRERVANQRKIEQRNIQTDQHERQPPPPFQRNPDVRQKPAETRERFANPRPQEPRPVQPDSKERVDMFGRTIRKEIPRSPSKSPKRQPARPHGRRRFSLSPSRSGSSSSGSRSHSGSGSGSESRSRSGSSSGSSVAPPSPVNKKKERTRRQPPPGTVSYGESTKTKAIDLAKVAGQKQQIKLTLKKPGPVKPIDKTVLDVDDDSGESDTDARILKKRKVEETAPENPPPPKKPRVPSPTTIASLTTGTVGIKKPSAARREELLKQLRAVEDAIARKRSKPL